MEWSGQGTTVSVMDRMLGIRRSRIRLLEASHPRHEPCCTIHWILLDLVGRATSSEAPARRTFRIDTASDVPDVLAKEAR